MAGMSVEKVLALWSVGEVVEGGKYDWGAEVGPSGGAGAGAEKAWGFSEPPRASCMEGSD